MEKKWVYQVIFKKRELISHKLLRTKTSTNHSWASREWILTALKLIELTHFFLTTEWLVKYNLCQLNPSKKCKMTWLNLGRKTSLHRKKSRNLDKISMRIITWSIKTSKVSYSSMLQSLVKSQLSFNLSQENWRMRLFWNQMQALISINRWWNLQSSTSIWKWKTFRDTKARLRLIILNTIS